MFFFWENILVVSITDPHVNGAVPNTQSGGTETLQTLKGEQAVS